MATTGRGARTHARIREAATRLFLEQGYLGTSTDAVARAAGIASKETLYRHYPSKEELFLDVLRSLSLEGPSLAGAFGSPQPIESTAQLRSVARNLVERIIETMLNPSYLALIRVILSELPRFPELATLFRQGVPEQALAGVAGLIERGITAGVVRSDCDPELAARMLLGTLLTYALFDGLFRPDRPPSPPDHLVIDKIVDHLMRALSDSEGDPQLTGEKP